MAAAEATAEFVQGLGRGEEEGALRKNNKQAEKGGACIPD